MHKRAISLQKYIDVFGHEAIRNAIKECMRRTYTNKLIGVTNPSMRFIINTSYEFNGHLYSHQQQSVPADDYGYFKFTASVLGKLKDEIKSNPDYLSELQRGLLSPNSGPMLSSLNEIIVGGFYKYQNIKVGFNSSKQKGLADVDLLEIPFASDAKTFPNSRLYFEDIVNASASELLRVIKLVRNQSILISVFTPDKKLIHKSLEKMAIAFEEDLDLARYSDMTLSAMIRNNDYSSDFMFSFNPNNVNVHFQASWDMGPAIDKLKESLVKADKQSFALDKESIPWVMVPRDANRHGIEISALRFIGELHGFVMDNKNMFAVPVYGLEFENHSVKTVFDIFETGSNTLGINHENFNKYVKELFSSQEYYV